VRPAKIPQTFYTLGGHGHTSSVREIFHTPWGSKDASPVVCVEHLKAIRYTCGN
jgi:hypothetical protein